jgi:hypothetical protein
MSLPTHPLRFIILIILIVYKTIIFLLFYMGVIFGRWHKGRNIDWRCLRTGCWGEYLDRREMKWREIGENCITS